MTLTVVFTLAEETQAVDEASAEMTDAEGAPTTAEDETLTTEDEQNQDAGTSGGDEDAILPEDEDEPENEAVDSGTGLE